MSATHPYQSSPSAPPRSPLLGAQRLRREFPILEREVHGKPLAYLDNAATTQKPLQVIEAITRFYGHSNSNVHRGVHLLSQEATGIYEGGRPVVQTFLGAADPREIVFLRGTTEAINLVASTWGRENVGEGDEVLVTHMEHHSNIVPWQMLCRAVGATLRVVPILDDGSLDMEAFDALLSDRTKIVAVVHVSNALGTVNPVREIARKAHDAGAIVLVDGAQAVPHMRVDVQDLDADFYAFSGHKVYGPTGVGALYGKAALLEAMPPWQGGGDMIRSVTFEETTWNEIPHKFEAGTPNIAGVAGLAAALEYLQSKEIDRVAAHEALLLEYGTALLDAVDGLRLVGTAEGKVGVLSFVMDGIHPHDVGTILDSQGVAVRTGHHCTQPIMDRFGIPATTRASLALYNTPEDLDALATGLRQVREVFA